MAKKPAFQDTGTPRLLPKREGAAVRTLTISSQALVEHEEVADAHLIIDVAPKTKATVFITVLGAACDMEVTVGEHADCSIICMQRSSEASVIRQKSRVEEGGRIHWHNITLGADIRQELSSELSGRGAASDIDWVFHASGCDKQSLSARNVFDAPDGGGEITMKGVAEGRALTECDGMIEITERGKGTNTYLTEDVLMLDASARVDAVPGLEIRTNDVKASHSATVSRVTAENLFYMRSRGITEELARTLYVEGFLADITERIEDPGLQQRVREVLMFS